METDFRLLLELFLTIGAAWIMGLLVRQLRLPLLVGYIFAGLLIGPHVSGIVRADSDVQAIAGLGIILLLFALGVELTLEELLRVRRVALWGGGAQIALTLLFGYLLGHWFGWNITARVILGFTLALSSTAVIVKVVAERQETHTQYARIILGINIMQDLSAVVLVGVLPALSFLPLRREHLSSLLLPLGLLLVKGLLLIAVLVILSRLVVPRLLRRVARTESRELFLISVVVLCLAGAGAAQAFGFSLALGAFLAGLLISESAYHHETYATVVPLRDIFGLLFFVSLGMFFNPHVVLLHLGAVIALVLALLIGKALLVMILVLWAGYHLRTAIMSGLALSQIGEFSFIILQLALPRGYITPDIYSMLIAAAILSMALTPAMLHLGPLLYRAAVHIPFLLRFTRAVADAPEVAQAHALHDHVLLCGYGRVGNVVGETLRHFEVPMVVIDYDQTNVEQLRTDGFLAVYGDASSPILLEQIGVDDVRMTVFALPESRDTLLALRYLNRVRPEMPKIARGVATTDLEYCYEYGADEVVHPEVECGLELSRAALLHLGFDPIHVQQYIDEVRLTKYRCGFPPE